MAYFAGPLGYPTGVENLVPKIESPGRHRAVIPALLCAVPGSTFPSHMLLPSQNAKTVLRHFASIYKLIPRCSDAFAFYIPAITSGRRICDFSCTSCSQRCVVATPLFPAPSTPRSKLALPAHTAVVIPPCLSDHRDPTIATAGQLHAPHFTLLHIPSISSTLGPHYPPPAASRNSSPKSTHLHPQDVLR